VSENQGNPRKEQVAEAIAQVLAGDENAYEIIYKCCDARLRAFAGRRYGRLGDDLVEEVVVRTHSRAFKFLGRYNPGRSSFMTWMFWQARAAAHEVMDERFDPRMRRLEEDLAVEYVTQATDPAREHERNERSRVLGEELDALSEQGRLSIAYHDMGGWTYDATALALGRTAAQVRYVRKLGLAELRRRLERRGVRPVEVVPVYGRVCLNPGAEDPEDGAAGPGAADQPEEPRPRAETSDAEQRGEVT
jgi:RNA polymerase sigma factor (sigma-70 family)